MTVKIERETVEYLKTTIVSDVALSGAPQFAFTEGDDRPATWIGGSWEAASVTLADGRYQRAALSPLIGDLTGVILEPGTYRVWLQIADTPEVPVEQFDHLIVA